MGARATHLISLSLVQDNLVIIVNTLLLFLNVHSTFYSLIGHYCQLF
jgi:hypothetical protein